MPTGGGGCWRVLEGEDSLSESEAEEDAPPAFALTPPTFALIFAWYEMAAGAATAAATAAAAAGVVDRAASSSLMSKSTIVEPSPKASVSAAAGPYSCKEVLWRRFLSSPEMFSLMVEEEGGGFMRCCPSMALSWEEADQEEKLGSGAMAIEGGRELLVIDDETYSSTLLRTFRFIIWTAKKFPNV
eukprot:CAMPEP_0171645128 /NCGR_PEP_ID=MMETSP0990-20121206/33870_1 /TAXON_ID=483369 /ORGANISM="non described non described, Strain CCMP2098" /LENGTH=185 /DNA_ID=CAMNT_0012221489 /DNA_START=141 /DNA_END=694 /DNA_ORIENTATION=-